MSRHKLSAADRRRGQRRRAANARRKQREQPKRLKQIEAAMNRIDKQRRRESDPRKRAALIREIAALGIQRKEHQQ